MNNTQEFINPEHKHLLPCYSYDDVNGISYFVYYDYKENGCALLSLRDWGNHCIAKFKVRKWKSNPNI